MGDLDSTISSIRDYIVSSKSKRDILLEELSSLSSKVVKYEKYLTTLEEFILFLDTLIESAQKDSISFIESVISRGLKDIFYDQDLSISIKVKGTKSSRSMQVFIVSDEMELPCEDFVGGGVLAVVSMLLGS